MEILAGLCLRLQSVLRTLSLSYADLPLVYQAEEHLNGLRNVLQRLELKNASQIGELYSFMHNAAVRLENADASKDDGMAVVLPAAAAQPAGIASVKSAEPLPVVANEAAFESLQQQSPLWLVNYGFALAEKAQPQETERLKAQWQRYLTSTALPAQNMTSWHEGMEQLSQLANRLNELDEKRGKYITVSELKSFVFSTTQSFAQAIPLEEQLRRLSLERTPPPAAKSEIDTHLQQIISRYGLIAASQK